MKPGSLKQLVIPAGDLFPDLKRKWSRAVLWLALSIPAVFVVGGIIG